LDDALCLLEERVLEHGTKTHKPSRTLVTTREQTFRFANFQVGTGAEDFWTKIYRYRTGVTFVANSGDLTEKHVWARGRECAGWRDTTYVNALEDTRWAGIDSVTASGCSMYTHFYEVFTDATLTTVLGWHPFNPDAPTAESFNWRYSYVYEPVARMTAPTSRCSPEISVRRRMIRDMGLFVLEPGGTRVEWDGRNDGGMIVGSGSYFVRIEAGSLGAAAKLRVVR
jgi:hypothetical protein